MDGNEVGIIYHYSGNLHRGMISSSESSKLSSGTHNKISNNTTARIIHISYGISGNSIKRSRQNNSGSNSVSIITIRDDTIQLLTNISFRITRDNCIDISISSHDAWHTILIITQISIPCRSRYIRIIWKDLIIINTSLYLSCNSNSSSAIYRQIS